MRRMLAAIAALVLACAPVAATSVAESRAQASPRLCADLAAGQLTVEILGDSVAAGYEVRDGRTWANHLYRSLPAGSAVWQGAVSGSLLRDYQPGGVFYYHVQFTKAVKPSLVIMNWRINDQWMSIEHTGYSPSQFKDRYLQVIGDIRAASPTTTFMIAVSPWILDTRIDDGQFSQWDYINALWDVHVATPGSLWMDWMRFMPRLGEDNAAGLLLYDLSHPSESGQSVLAAHTYERIVSYCLGMEGTTP